MSERIMTEKQVKKHQEKMRKMRGVKGGKASATALRKKSIPHKGVDPDKTQEYETRFSKIWLAIKELESRVIQLESKEEDNGES